MAKANKKEQNILTLLRHRESGIGQVTSHHMCTRTYDIIRCLVLSKTRTFKKVINSEYPASSVSLCNDKLLIQNTKTKTHANFALVGGMLRQLFKIKVKKEWDMEIWIPPLICMASVNILKEYRECFCLLEKEPNDLVRYDAVTGKELHRVILPRSRSFRSIIFDDLGGKLILQSKKGDGELSITFLIFSLWPFKFQSLFELTRETFTSPHHKNSQVKDIQIKPGAVLAFMSNICVYNLDDILKVLPNSQTDYIPVLKNENLPPCLLKVKTIEKFISFSYRSWELITQTGYGEYILWDLKTREEIKKIHVSHDSEIDPFNDAQPYFHPYYPSVILFNGATKLNFVNKGENGIEKVSVKQDTEEATLSRYGRKRKSVTKYEDDTHYSTDYIKAIEVCYEDELSLFLVLQVEEFKPPEFNEERNYIYTQLVELRLLDNNGAVLRTFPINEIINFPLHLTHIHLEFDRDIILIKVQFQGKLRYYVYKLFEYEHEYKMTSKVTNTKRQ